MNKFCPIDYLAQRESIASRLREARIKKNIEGRQLALMLGIRADTLSQMERGKQKLPSELLLSWCEILGIPIASVLGRYSSKRAPANGAESYAETFLKLSPKCQDLVLGHFEMVCKLDQAG